MLIFEELNSYKEFVKVEYYELCFYVTVIINLTGYHVNDHSRNFYAKCGWMGRVKLYLKKSENLYCWTRNWFWFKAVTSTGAKTVDPNHLLMHLKQLKVDCILQRYRTVRIGNKCVRKKKYTRSLIISFTLSFNATYLTAFSNKLQCIINLTCKNA